MFQRVLLDFVLNSFGLGAENETRTRDPNLGKVVLYQLSYFRNTNILNFTTTTFRLRVQRYTKFFILQIFSQFFSIFFYSLRIFSTCNFTDSSCIALKI